MPPRIAILALYPSLKYSGSIIIIFFTSFTYRCQYISFCYVIVGNKEMQRCRDAQTLFFGTWFYKFFCLMNWLVIIHYSTWFSISNTFIKNFIIISTIRLNVWISTIYFLPINIDIHDMLLFDFDTGIFVTKTFSSEF